MTTRACGTQNGGGGGLRGVACVVLRVMSGLNASSCRRVHGSTHFALQAMPRGLGFSVSALMCTLPPMHTISDETLPKSSA